MSRLTLAALSLGLVVALTGCGSTPAPSGSGTSTTPAATGENAKLEGKLEVVSFQGGYGIDFFEAAGKEFAAKNPGLEVAVTGNPRVWEQLRPRFVGGNPPDVTWPGWGMDYWALVYDDQIMDLNAELDKPAYGETSGKWRDTFDPGLLKMGQYQGKQFLMPYHVNLNGWWYNPKMFRENGWTVPKTFSELIALNDKIKAKGIAPLTFQGQYPYYMLFGFVYPWIISAGGIEAWKDCQNLVPGAWKSPAVLEAARKTAELVKRGDFQKGALALNHTDSQMEFLKGNAAMIPCGTWLYSEMKNVMPAGAELEFMAVPALDDGKGDPTALQVGIEPFIVPSKGKNPAAGVEFFRFLTSRDNAKKFIEQKGTLMGITGLKDVNYPPHLKRAAELFEASKTKWSADIKLWYPAMGKEAENAMAALLDGKITPEQFCERVEAAAEKTRNDKNIIKHKVE